VPNEQFRRITSLKRFLQRRGALIAWVTVLTVTGVLGVLWLRDDLAWPALVLGLLAGLGLGAAIAFVWDQYSGRLKSVSDVEAATGLPVLAAIPTLRMEGPGRGAATVRQPAEGLEAYRQLADGLAGRLRESGASCLLVTSPTKQAGRTTIAVILAALFAADGMKVVLVSADPRGVRVDQLLGLQPQPGLIQVLNGSSSLDSALQASAVQRLSVLTAGGPSGRARLGYSLDDLALLLDRLAKSVDLIVIEAPPVLGAGVETVLLVQDVDLVLVAVDVRRGRRSDASLAVSYLGHVEEKLVGCVANDPGRYRYRRRSVAPAATAGRNRSLRGGLVAAGAGLGVRLRRAAGPAKGAVAVGSGAAGTAAGAPRARLAPSTQRGTLRRHRWVGVIAATVAVALVISTVWWLSYDDRFEAQQNPGPDASPAATAPSGQAMVAVAMKECRSKWDAQAAPLQAAAASVQQWQVHVAAMNQLVAGRITLDQANAFWERTRVRAAQKVHRFQNADATYTAGRYSCRTPAAARNTDVNLAALSACQRNIAQREDALRAARAAINTWHHHVMDMNMLRAGVMSPAHALHLWRKYWKHGVAELSAYHTQLRQTNNQHC
jgi:Mrp family chromosome partitioning ATPase